MLPARPTLRALREDLKITIPPIDEPLDRIEHPLPAKAREQFADDNASHERIRAIDDQVLRIARDPGQQRALRRRALCSTSRMRIQSHA